MQDNGTSLHLESLALTAICLLALVQPAHAYLDPGAGSMLLQVILGGAAGIAVLARVVWKRLTSRSARNPPPDTGACQEKEGKPTP